MRSACGASEAIVRNWLLPGVNEAATTGPGSDGRGTRIPLAEEELVARKRLEMEVPEVGGEARS